MGRGRRGLFVLLLAGILLPGAILAVLGFRSLRQDRLLAERQTLDSLQTAAELAVREVNRELEHWAEWQDPHSALLTFSSDGRVQSATGLLWLPGGLADPPLPSNIDRAEEAEIRQRDYAKALQLYAAALQHIQPDAKPVLLLRIARTARKLGDLVQARACWRRILTLPPSPSTAAARLALVEAADATAIDLYRDLVAGRIPLARESYFFYSERLKELLPASDHVKFRDRERQAVALTKAAEAFLDTRRRIPAPGFLAFWWEGKAVVIPENALHARLSKAAQSGMDASIFLANSDAAIPPVSAWRALDDRLLPWRLVAAPRDPAMLAHTLHIRQNWFLGAMAAVLAALISGVVLMARTVRREWEFSQLQSEFVATVSHEFRSPLTGIRQLGELLESGVVSSEERRREYYGLIVQESDRLAHLVENLLDFSRLESGRKQYRMESINVSEWLSHTAAGTRCGRLRADIPPGLPTVRGDRGALASAVVNLLDNACKYSPPETPVRLAACADGGKLSITVSDTGPGIAYHEQVRIFDRFYRGGGDLSRQVKGAGIGLSIVKRIVEDHGGRVSVTSRLGEGSTFTIELNGAVEQPG